MRMRRTVRRYVHTGKGRNNKTYNREMGKEKRRKRVRMKIRNHLETYQNP